MANNCFHYIKWNRTTQVAFYLLKKSVGCIAVLGQYTWQRGISVLKLRIVRVVGLEEPQFFFLQVGGLYSSQYTKFLSRKIVSFFKTSRQQRLWLWKRGEKVSLHLSFNFGFRWQHCGASRNRDLVCELCRTWHWTSEKHSRLPFQAAPSTTAQHRHWGFHLAKVFTARRAGRPAGFPAPSGAGRGRPSMWMTLLLLSAL